MLEKLRYIFGDAMKSQSLRHSSEITDSVIPNNRKRPRHIALDIHDDDTLISTSQPTNDQRVDMSSTIIGNTSKRSDVRFQHNRRESQNHTSADYSRRSSEIQDQKPSPDVDLTLPRRSSKAKSSSARGQSCSKAPISRMEQCTNLTPPHKTDVFSKSSEKQENLSRIGSTMHEMSDRRLRQMSGHLSEESVEKLIIKSIAPIIEELKSLQKKVNLLESCQNQSTLAVAKELAELKTEITNLRELTLNQRQVFDTVLDNLKPLLHSIQQSIERSNAEIGRLGDILESKSRQPDTLQMVENIRARGIEQLGAIDNMTTQLEAVSYKPLSIVSTSDPSKGDSESDRLGADVENGNPYDPALSGVSHYHSPELSIRSASKVAPSQQLVLYDADLEQTLPTETLTRKAIVISKEEADRKALQYRRKKKVRRKIADYFKDVVKQKVNGGDFANLHEDGHITSDTQSSQHTYSIDEIPETENEQGDESDSKLKASLQLNPRIDINEFATQTTSAIQLTVSRQEATLTHIPTEVFAKLRWMIDYVKANLQFPSLNGIPPHQVHSWLRLVFYFAAIFNIPKGSSFTCNDSCEFSVDLFVTEGIADIENNWAAHSPDCQYQQKAIDMLANVDHVGKPMHWVLDEVAKLLSGNLESSQLKKLWKVTFDCNLSEEASNYLLHKCQQ